MKWKTSIACLVIISLFALPVWCDEPRDISEINERISIGFPTNDVKGALRMLMRFTNLNIVFDECVQGRVSINADNVPFNDLFRSILNDAALDYKQEGDVIRITCKADKKTTIWDSNDSMALPDVQNSSDWKDPSPHSVQFVTVDEDVQLEVLDWGGSGRPIVLLAGQTATAHIYDDFAPKLTKDYHVLGITRRGIGASSKPDSGYEADRLGDDVIAVLDSLKLEHPVLVGHSIAGQELSSVASRFPDRVSGLIYLDAAYQYAFDAFDSGGSRVIKKGFFEPAPQIPSSGENPAQQKISVRKAPLPGEADLRSISAYRSWSERINGYVVPEAEMRRLLIISPDGRIIGNRKEPEETRYAMEAILQGHQSYKNIPVRCLAIYADHSFQEPWLKEAEPEVEEQNAEKKSKIKPDITEHFIKAFEKGVPSARVVRLTGADHMIFNTNEEEVLREMRKFLESLD